MAILAQLVDDVVVNKIQLDKPEITVGRHPDNVIQINDEAISGKHAVIKVQKSQYIDGAFDIFIVDLGSKNGTFVNGEAVSGQRRLQNNDVLRFAWNEFKLIDANADGSMSSTAHILQ